MLVKTIDGTPDAVKVARPVWSGGKSGDNFKGLPITIRRDELTESSHPLCGPGLPPGGKEYRAGIQDFDHEFRKGTEQPI